MASMSNKKSSSSKNKTAQTTSQSIQKQTEEYLKGGGQINIIESGISGFKYSREKSYTTASKTKI